MNDLLKNGTIYCNPISYFTNKEIKENPDGRYDFNELVTKMEYRKEGYLHVSPLNDPSKVYKFELKHSHYKEHITNPIGNLFCLFNYEPNNYKPKKWYILDERLEQFGTHYVLIRNNVEFAKRIKMH
ncbi:hypothetical protein ACFSR6_00070 [Pedobacter vanadiisoli]|uniref:Uncharacterized protein n=1 Tax=Pedobacter vanadiisoli TaxID=1761975 RepID=A0ABW5MED2_9SPHI